MHWQCTGTVVLLQWLSSRETGTVSWWIIASIEYLMTIEEGVSSNISAFQSQQYRDTQLGTETGLFPELVLSTWGLSCINCLDTTYANLARTFDIQRSRTVPFIQPLYGSRMRVDFQYGTYRNTIACNAIMKAWYYIAIWLTSIVMRYAWRRSCWFESFGL